MNVVFVRVRGHALRGHLALLGGAVLVALGGALLRVASHLGSGVACASFRASLRCLRAGGVARRAGLGSGSSGLCWAQNCVVTLSFGLGLYYIS